MKSLEDKTLLGPTCHRQTSLKAIRNLGWLPQPLSRPHFPDGAEIWTQVYLTPMPGGFPCELQQEPHRGPQGWPGAIHRHTGPAKPALQPAACSHPNYSLRGKCPFCNLHAKWILATGFYWETDSLFPTPSIRKHIVFFTVVHFAFRGD